MEEREDEVYFLNLSSPPRDSVAFGTVRHGFSMIHEVPGAMLSPGEAFFRIRNSLRIVPDPQTMLRATDLALLRHPMAMVHGSPAKCRLFVAQSHNGIDARRAAQAGNSRA